MVRPQVLQADMADFRVDAGGQLLVADNGRVFGRPPLRLQRNYIVTVRGKLLAAVGGDPLPAFLLEGRGESLGLLFCALFRPGGGNVKGGRPGLELPPVRPPATVDTDGIGDQLARLVPALLDVSHFAIPPLETATEC